MKIGDMELEIHKTWYNKTRVLEDGVTHEIDPTQHTVYQFGMAKNYFGIEDKKEVTKQIIHDIRETANHLEQLLNKEQSQEQEPDR